MALKKACRFPLASQKFWKNVKKALMFPLNPKFNDLAGIWTYLSLMSSLWVVPHEFDEKAKRLVPVGGFRKLGWYAGFFGLVQARVLFMVAAPLVEMVRFKPIGHKIRSGKN